MPTDGYATAIGGGRSRTASGVAAVEAIEAAEAFLRNAEANLIANPPAHSQ